MEIAYDDRGLVAVIVQDWRSGEVLTLAYANAEAVRRTRAGTRSSCAATPRSPTPADLSFLVGSRDGGGSWL